MPFASKSVKQFSKEWHFNIVTSSPHYPQSNGLAECNVQTINMIFKKARDSGTDQSLALFHDITSNDSFANNENDHSVGGEVAQPSSEQCLRYGQVIRPPKRYRDD